MGKRLLKAFTIARDEGGIMAQTRLAMKFGKSAQMVENIPDSLEDVKKMQDALAEVTGKVVIL